MKAFKNLNTGHTYLVRRNAKVKADEFVAKVERYPTRWVEVTEAEARASKPGTLSEFRDNIGRAWPVGSEPAPDVPGIPATMADELETYTRADLVELAESFGLKVSKKDTKASLVGKITKRRGQE